MKKLIIIAALLGLCVRVANASTLDIQGGVLHTPNSNYGDAGTYNARLSVPVYQAFDVAFEIGHHGNTEHDPYGSVSGQHALIEAVYNAPQFKNVRPYVLAGVGYSHWAFDASEDTSSRGISVKLGDALATKYAVGAAWPVNKDWAVTLEWAYFHAHVPKDAVHSDGTPSAILGDDDRQGRTTFGEEETNVMLGARWQGDNFMDIFKWGAK